ncbi:MAG: hypothetical protein GC162_00765 [Planctomycetes bacterium]|nr:hypothetical protein [Planctomycetota bacterium]
MVNFDPQFMFASAISDEEETIEAVDEALSAVVEALGGGTADMVIVFATPHHRKAMPYVAQQIARRLKPRVTLGATAAGVIGSGYELETRSGLSILAGRLGGAKLHAFSHQNFDWPDVKSDPQALREALVGVEHDESEPVRALLLFADPFSTPLVRFMPAVNGAMPGVPMIGGIASGGNAAGENRLILNEQVFTEGAVGVAITGPVHVDTIVSQGCRPIGEPWIITKAHKNLIQEIGRRPTLQVIQSTADTADDSDRDLLRHGVFVGRVINEYKDRFGRGDFLIRNIIGADRDAGFIAVSDFVRVGQTIQFHVRDRRTAEEDLRLLLQTQLLHGPAAGVLLCTCNGRGSHLFDQPNTESKIIREAMGEVPMAGFFAAGEIGPIGQTNFLHGYTASMAVFRPLEAEDAPAD